MHTTVFNRDRCTFNYSQSAEITRSLGQCNLCTTQGTWESMFSQEMVNHTQAREIKYRVSMWSNVTVISHFRRGHIYGKNGPLAGQTKQKCARIGMRSPLLTFGSIFPSEWAVDYLTQLWKGTNSLLSSAISLSTTIQLQEYDPEFSLKRLLPDRNCSSVINLWSLKSDILESII